MICSIFKKEIPTQVITKEIIIIKIIILGKEMIIIRIDKICFQVKEKAREVKEPIIKEEVDLVIQKEVVINTLGLLILVTQAGLVQCTDL